MSAKHPEINNLNSRTLQNTMLREYFLQYRKQSRSETHIFTALILGVIHESN